MGSRVDLTLLDGSPVPCVVIVVVEVAGGLFGDPIIDHTIGAEYTVRKIQRVCEPCPLCLYFLKKPFLKQNTWLDELFRLDTTMRKSLACCQQRAGLERLTRT